MKSARIRVAQCWDDGVATDARLIEILKKYNAKATFNLCPGNAPKIRLNPFWVDRSHRGWGHNGFVGGSIGRSEMRDIYKDFKVASHCWKHEVAGSMPNSQFVEAAVKARKYLENLFQMECPGFAWPCGAGGVTAETIRQMRNAGFEYGRTTLNSPDVLPCDEPMMLKPTCHFQNRNFWKLFEDAKKTSRVFYFWGHSYEMYEYDPLWAQIEDKIKELSEDPDVEWVDVIDLVRN